MAICNFAGVEISGGSFFFHSLSFSLRFFFVETPATSLVGWNSVTCRSRRKEKKKKNASNRYGKRRKLQHEIIALDDYLMSICILSVIFNESAERWLVAARSRDVCEGYYRSSGTATSSTGCDTRQFFFDFLNLMLRKCSSD